MSELKPCMKCKHVPELIDGRMRWFTRCKCKTGENVVYGQDVSFLDHISLDDDELTDKVSNIVFDLVPWERLKQSAIDNWNIRQLTPAQQCADEMYRKLEHVAEFFDSLCEDDAANEIKALLAKARGEL